MAKNNGDALTYKVLTVDNDVIIRSVIRKPDNPIYPNIIVRSRDDEKFKLESETNATDLSQLNLPEFLTLKRSLAGPTSRTAMDVNTRSKRRNSLVKGST